MHERLRFQPASAFSLEQFAHIFTLSFEGYFYPGITTAQILAERARVEQTDLHRSLVLLDGDEPIAQAVLGLRGSRAWCGGFGVYAAHRGRGVAHVLLEALVGQAREAGARTFGLEVLTRNQRAIRAYHRAGLSIRRQLYIYEWSDEDENNDTSDWPAVPVWQAAPADAGVATAEPAQLLAHFARLHPVTPAWQRELASLLVRANVHGLVLGQPDYPAAYALYVQRDNTARIIDLAATSTNDAQQLLNALKHRFQKLISVNEPSDSPITPVYRACGFSESDRQHEMAVEL